MAVLSRQARWGRSVQFWATLLLQMAPFLAWARFPVLGLTLGVPGILLHGAFAVGAGLIGMGLLLFRGRHPGILAALGGVAAAAALWDWHLVQARTDYWLGSVQLLLAPFNDVVVRTGLSGVRLLPTGWHPADYVGPGIGTTLVACAGLLVGALVEAASYASTRRPLSVLMGAPACRRCGHGAGYDMSYCPQCGQMLAEGQACEHCGHWMERDYRYCSSCGSQSPKGS